VAVTIPFTFLTGTTIPTIAKLPNDFGTFAGAFRPAYIYVIGPSKELPDIAHADQTIPTLTVGITISILVLTRATEGTEIVMSFPNRTILIAIRINACQADIGIRRKPEPVSDVVHTDKTF
jgi:hypothetical protein